MAGVLAGFSGCHMAADYGGTAYLCPDGECPDGLSCVDGTCAAGRFDGGASDDAPAAGDDAGGRPAISIEAESYRENLTRGETPWVADDTDGHSGNAAMLAQGPGISAIMWPDYYTMSSRLDYRVELPEPGTYFVWIRGIGASGSDTCIPGLDGTGWASAANPSGSLWVPVAQPIAWTWGGSDGLTSERVTLAVAVAGEHTFNLWLREDGVIVDKILLTSDADYVPIGLGAE